MAALAIIGNPRKRRKAKRVSAVKRVSATPKRKVARKRRSNPLSAAQLSAHARIVRKHKFKRVGGKKTRTVVRRMNPLNAADLKKLGIPAVIGAAGSVAVSEAVDKLLTSGMGAKLPVSLQSGIGRTLLEAGVAVGLGAILDKTKVVKSADTRNALVIGALTGIAIKAINRDVLPKLKGATSMSGYQLMDVSALSGYQAAQAPVPSLGYLNSSPTVGVVSNIRDFRRARTA